VAGVARAALGSALAYAEKGGAEENWPGPLIALLVVAIVLVVAGIVCMFFIGNRGRPAG
jgi:heme/copper-type cytochrome/quinol oxidase subunit 2